MWYGRYPTVDATTKENIAITLPKDYSLKNIRVLARYDEPVAAPVKVGQQIGEIVIEKNGDIVKRIPMIAKERVRKIQLFGRVFKNISVMIWGK